MTKDFGKLWAERMTRSERDTSFPDSEPRDAATLMLIDRSGPAPRVLLGRRHAGHKFMPGKFVFPGGRIEAFDQMMTAVSELHPDAQKKLLERVEKPSTEFARAFALAAVRETAEETGLLLGVKRDQSPSVPGEIWT
ncbi:MAG: NUDIX hydrolase, partial [Pseudolabrys sp.]